MNEAAAPKTDLVFAGLVALMDPPKEGVDTAIQACHQASIKVTMVTGDHPLTAEAIARKVNIITGRTAREVAAEDGVDEDTIALSDPRVEAVVFSGEGARGGAAVPAHGVGVSAPVACLRMCVGPHSTHATQARRSGISSRPRGIGTRSCPSRRSSLRALRRSRCEPLQLPSFMPPQLHSPPFSAVSVLRRS